MCLQEVINNKVYISLCIRKYRLLIITYKCADEKSSIDLWSIILHTRRRETHAIYVHVCARRHEKNPREAIADWLWSRGDGFDAIADWFGCLWISFSCLETSFSSLETSFSCLDTRKGGKRKSSPQPGAGKLAGYMIEMIVYPAFIFQFSFFTSPLAR